MNIRNLFKVRDKLELKISRGDYKRIFEVRVQDISEDGFSIDRPIIDPVIFPSRVGLEVDVILSREDAAYSLTTTIIEELRRKKIPLLKLAFPTEVVRMQRRMHFRLDVSLPIFYKLEPDEEKETNPEYQKGTIINLSAGGVKFKVDNEISEDIKLGSNLILLIELSDDESLIETKANIIKLIRKDQERTSCDLICSFIDVSKKVRKRIVVHNIRFQQKYRTEKRN